MAKVRLTALAAVAMLVIAGCGGGDSNKTLSYSDFSKQANDICKEADANTSGQKLTGQAKTDAPVFKELLDKQQASIDKFKDLKPPKELQSDFDKFNSISDQQVAAAKEASDLASKGDQAAYVAKIKEIQQSPLQEQSKIEGSKLGAAACAT
jgi:hypothetical protein